MPFASHLQVEKINMEQRNKIEELEHDLEHSEVSTYARKITLHSHSDVTG
jgi:hypothetical protein